MVLQLASRVDRIVEKATKLFLALLASSFHDVGRNGHGCSKNLIAEGAILTAANLGGGAMNVQYESVGLPPDMEFLEICHAEGWAL